MKIIGIRIFGVFLIVLGLNMMLCSSWFAVEGRIAQSTANTSREGLIKVSNSLTFDGYRKSTKKEDFIVDYNQFKEKLTIYNQTYIYDTRLPPYFISALAILIASFYVSAGIGTIRLRLWSRKIIIIGTILFPIFYGFIVFSVLFHLNFLDSIVIDVRNLLNYLETDTSELYNITALNEVNGKLIMAGVSSLFIFIIIPLSLFFTPAISEELS